MLFEDLCRLEPNLKIDEKYRGNSIESRHNERKRMGGTIKFEDLRGSLSKSDVTQDWWLICQLKLHNTADI